MQVFSNGLSWEFNFKVLISDPIISTFVPQVEVLAVDIGPEFGPIVPPIGADDGGVELRSDIDIYWGLMIEGHRGGCMEKSGKRRDTQTGKDEGFLNSFTSQIRKFRAAHDTSTYMNAEDTPEEADMKRRKKELEEMARRGMR